MLTIRRTSAVTLRSIAMCRNYCKDYASSDDEKENKKAQKKEKKPKIEGETAAVRLNRLLATMPTDDPYNVTKSATTENKVSRPGDTIRKRREALKTESANKDIFKAVKRVASMLGDQQQQQQTESELLAKLLGHAATESTAKSQDTNKKPTAENEMNLSELIVGMKIDRNPQSQEQVSRSDFVRRALNARPQRSQQQNQSQIGGEQQQQKRKREAATFTGSVNLFGGNGLGIFKNLNDLQHSADMLATWAQLQQRELQQNVTHPPSNYFEKIALWTEQGKVWRFPIDNEQDWTAEEITVDFSEHIFLEQHLESWCPTKGPVRHFMELVCVGLSKNPYLTAREKKEHILWYRDYFEDKREILKELMQQEKPKKLTTATASKNESS